MASDFELTYVRGRRSDMGEERQNVLLMIHAHVL